MNVNTRILNIQLIEKMNEDPYYAKKMNYEVKKVEKTEKKEGWAYENCIK